MSCVCLPSLASPSKSLRALLAALIVATGAIGCAAPADDGAQSGDQHLEGDDDDDGAGKQAPTPAQLPPQKLFEVPAQDEGKLGISSWVVYGTVKDKKSYLTALGTNLDGDLMSLMHVDLSAKALLVYENKSRDGSSLERNDSSEVLQDYSREMQAILERLASLSTTDGTTHTQAIGSRLQSCVLTGFMAAAAAGLAFTGTVLVVVTAPVVGAVTATAALVGGAVAATVGGTVLGELLTEDHLSVSGTIKNLGEVGRMVADSAAECVTGSKGSKG